MNTQKLMFGVLTIGLLGIYILHFTGKGGTAEKNNASDTLPAPSGNLQVFYVQADSVIGNFDMMQDLDQKFRSDNSIRESKLMDAKARFERKLKEYENKAPTLTTRERGKYEEELQQMQGQLMQDNQELSQMAAMQEAQMIGQVYDSLHVYFAEIGEDLKADFILAAQKTSGVLYANPQRDITTKAIEHINARYARSQSSNQPE